MAIASAKTSKAVDHVGTMSTPSVDVATELVASLSKKIGVELPSILSRCSWLMIRSES